TAAGSDRSRPDREPTPDPAAPVAPRPRRPILAARARLLVLPGLLLAAASPRPDAPDAAPAGPAALITGSAAAAPSPAPVAGDDPPLALPPIAGPAPGSPAAFRIDRKSVV